VEYPRRIVCLSDETAETLYLLGEQDRIVGVSGFSTRPPEVRTKPRISAFRDANVEAIIALRPDLVLAFSDVQAEITKQLVLRGLSVLNFNQRTVNEIFESIAVLSRIVNRVREGETIIARLRRGLDDIASSAKSFTHRPTVYFEEWHDPLISGIAWADELIEIAGGEIIFPELRTCGKARERVVEPDEVLRRDPEIIFASWCGMKVDVDAIRSRPGWASMRAVNSRHIYEIPSGIILQPGPAALTDGVRMLHEKLAAVSGIEISSAAERTDFLL
jgi:iron complex transport system substrate-binding protein